MYKITSEPNVNSGFWILMMYQCRFISLVTTHVTLWWKTLIWGRLCIYRDEGYKGKSISVPYSECC